MIPPDVVRTGIVELPVRLSAGVLREPSRAKCSICLLRRVLYRVVVASMTGNDATDARCAPCWGIRD